MSVTTSDIEQLIGTVIPRRSAKPIPRTPTLQPKAKKTWDVAYWIFTGFMAFMLGIITALVIIPAEPVAPPVDPAIAAMLKHTKSFGVLCPTTDMTTEEQQQWVSYVAAKGYSAYPAAGAGCVDP